MAREATTSTVSEAPTTVFARHQVRPGKREVFESWVHGITKASARYPGYMGTEVVRPSETDADDYVIIFRFDTQAHLGAWLESAERKVWIDRVDEFSDAPHTLDYHSLEFWFSPEQNQGRAPAKYKMGLVTLVVIWPLVHFVPRLIARILPAPPLALELVSVAAIVVLMTYLVMPTATRVLKPWLY